MPQPLTDDQRKTIHDFALDARELLTGEAQELLEGTYGLYPDGHLDPLNKLPRVKGDPETGATYRRLAQFLEDEERAGLPRPEAVSKLVKEVAFTHLNRLVAFKMMEVRKLIRGTVDRGTDSNAYKFYLADPDHADDYALYQAGDADGAYRHFLLWQSAQVAAEVRVLFDPDTLPSRLFPRPRALNAVLEMLNGPELENTWQADETIGWVYQYFNEPELQAAFEKVRTSGTKFETADIPSATQLFTPHWIVRFLVQNTLGRLWVQMHPDTRLVDTELLDYLVALEGEVPSEPLRPIKEITLLDPACGTMHFSLVAFDLFAAMYQEELEHAEEPGWPEAPSVSGLDEIPAAIIRHNLYGIDIDLRAVQLSALALYLKAKALSPKARITDGNLACADVTPLDNARLGTFLREARFTRPVYERLIRSLWERLGDVNQLGSLLRLEQEIEALIDEEKARYAETPLFAGLEGEFEREAAEDEFWDLISAQVVQGLDAFARHQAEVGVDQSFFAHEAVKGLRLADLMLRRYDVVVTNPPYLSRRKMNRELMELMADNYPKGKGDFFAAFIQRCLELAESHGYVGMLTMHSFMFISSYEALRDEICSRATIETMIHCGPGLFDVGNPGTLQTVAFVLHSEPEMMRREENVGIYYRLVHEPDSAAKRESFEQALRDSSNTYRTAQRRFSIIPSSPWVYWVNSRVCELFTTLPALGEVAIPRQGAATSDNFRFLRMWWEQGLGRIQLGHTSLDSAKQSKQKWFPYMKGGGFKRWYGNLLSVANWYNDGAEMKAVANDKRRKYSPNAKGDLWSAWINSTDYYFQEGVTYSYLTSGAFSARLLPPGFIFDVAGSSIFSSNIRLILAVANSTYAHYTLKLVNPTVNFQIGDVTRLPIPVGSSEKLEMLVDRAVSVAKARDSENEIAFTFTTPLRWNSGIDDLAVTFAKLANLERQINDEVYHLCGIGDKDRAIIEAELAGGTLAEDEDTEHETHSTSDNGGEERDELEAPMTREELAVRWISYAVGIVLGRFQPGVAGALGSAVYCRADFAIGSLPEPDETEFDELVGTPERFAYLDADGGRHLFPIQVEASLSDLALSDGIAVLDEGHPRDLPTLVKHALDLMLGDESSQEIIAEGTGGDLQRVLERDFFTKWHLRWYRKRPVYWPLQSAKRNYGFVLFHERIDRSTLYTLQREYLDHKLNGLRLEIGDLQGRLAGLSGSARRQVERQIDRATQLLDEVSDFAQTIEQVVREGYEPERDWIDDGVILRMAPLWELIPIWKSEPKKYWERLQRGDYDWSHIAMRYWPERVREKCKSNKSFAIAHGHEEWYKGT